MTSFEEKIDSYINGNKRDLAEWLENIDGWAIINFIKFLQERGYRL